jgi:hypothetical protein
LKGVPHGERLSVACYDDLNPRPSTEVDRVVARSGVRVLGRDEVQGNYKGVSESVPPGGGGALVAAAPLRTLSRAFVFLPPTFWWGKASPKSRVLTKYTAPNAFFLCTRSSLILSPTWE